MEAPIVHGVIHTVSRVGSRYAALSAEIEVIFHVSTGIHSVVWDFRPAVINTRPQCVKDADGCG